MESEIVMTIGDEVSRPKLAELDRFHMKKGDYAEWMLSEERTHFSGNQVVRVINWSNLREVCRMSGLDEARVVAAYHEVVQTGDILFVTYEEDTDEQNPR